MRVLQYPREKAFMAGSMVAVVLDNITGCAQDNELPGDRRVGAAFHPYIPLQRVLPFAAARLAKVCNMSLCSKKGGMEGGRW